METTPLGSPRVKVCSGNIDARKYTDDTLQSDRDMFGDDAVPVYLCMYPCMCVYARAHVCVVVYASTYVIHSMYIICLYGCACMCVCTYVCTFVSMHVYVRGVRVFLKRGLLWSKRDLLWFKGDPLRSQGVFYGAKWV